MLTDDGLKVLEFNVRFGDPESQVVLSRWEGDATETLAAAASGTLSDDNAPAFGGQAAVCVVLASPGYPEKPETGAPIEGLGQARALRGAHIYAAGVGEDADGCLVTAGGRRARGDRAREGPGRSRGLAYQATGMVSWPGLACRSDIGVQT